MYNIFNYYGNCLFLTRTTGQHLKFTSVFGKAIIAMPIFVIADKNNATIMNEAMPFAYDSFDIYVHYFICRPV